MDNLKPTIVVSKCLGFDKCRYNGDTIPDKFVNILNNYVNYITICPEVEIGLSVPRQTIRLISENNEIKLYEPSTGRELTRKMKDFTKDFFSSLPEVDAFILKGRSPSCGTKDVKVYLGKEKATGSFKSTGFFGGAVLRDFHFAAIEEEGRLKNLKIREHFLTKLYTFFRFRKLKEEMTVAGLAQFQSNNKYLLMSYNQKEQKLLGRIASNQSNLSLSAIFKSYEEHLILAFARVPRYTSNINALQHIFGYFSEKLSPKERTFFLSTLENYREGKVPVSVPIYLLKGYAIKYEDDYILSQTILCPFPEGLMDMTDSGKGEDY